MGNSKSVLDLQNGSPLVSRPSPLTLDRKPVFYQPASPRSTSPNLHFTLTVSVLSTFVPCFGHLLSIHKRKSNEIYKFSSFAQSHGRCRFIEVNST